MKHTRSTQYVDYDGGDAMMDDDFDDDGLGEDSEDGDINLVTGSSMAYRRTWRDTEKYKEMRELYKLINDELYTGLQSSDLTENEY